MSILGPHLSSIHPYPASIRSLPSLSPEAGALTTNAPSVCVSQANGDKRLLIATISILRPHTSRSFSQSVYPHRRNFGSKSREIGTEARLRTSVGIVKAGSISSGLTIRREVAMVGATRYELRQEAYVKLVLHALKHKTSAVNGVLIGRVAEDAKASDGKVTVEVTDCVPLFHGQLGLLPMLELALTQVLFLFAPVSLWMWF